MTDFLFNQDIKKSFEIHDCSKLKDFLMNNYKKDGDYNLSFKQRRHRPQAFCVAKW